MKKALAILLALSMVFVAFADEPATNYSVAEFSGSASLEWISDLDKEENGFANATEAKLKINLLNGGDKATSGDGVWGELKIEIETPDALENPGALTIGKTAEVKTAKIHFVDGDVGIALNILKPGLALGENVLPTAVGADVKSDKFDVSSLAPVSAAYKTAKDAYDAAEKALADLKKANTYTPEALLAAERLVTSTKKTLDETAAPAALKAGFALEITSSVIDANFKVMDNGVAADKEWGFGADATVKAVENLNLKAGFAYAFEKTAFVASVDYKLGINDSLYVKPAVAFGLMDETKQLAASALFGWGTEGQEPNFIKDGGKDKDNNDTRFIANKCADGFSVTFKTNMADPAVNSIAFGLYDSTLLAGLKVGAAYGATLDAFGKGTLSLAAKYGTDIDILTIALDFGFRTTFGTEKSSLYAYAVELSTDDVIDNTKLYAKYESLTAKGADTAKGKITVGAKIAL